MINKENVDPKKEKRAVDTAKGNANDHILIKDRDTGKVILNKRG